MQYSCVACELSLQEVSCVGVSWPVDSRTRRASDEVVHRLCRLRIDKLYAFWHTHRRRALPQSDDDHSDTSASVKVSVERYGVDHDCVSTRGPRSLTKPSVAAQHRAMSARSQDRSRHGWTGFGDRAIGELRCRPDSASSAHTTTGQSGGQTSGWTRQR